MQIAILSKGRAGKVTTFRHWPDAWRTQTWLVVPQTERLDYADTWPNVVTHPNLDRLGPTRQFACDYFDDDHIVFLDDDISLVARRPEKTTVIASADDISLMLTTLQSWLIEGVAHVGIGRYFYNHIFPDVVTNAATPYNVWGFNRVAVRAWGFRFDRIEIFGDVDYTIETLRRGYQNRVYYKVVQAIKEVNQLGGVSAYRTPEMQVACVQKLVHWHSDKYVAARQTKNNWKNWPYPYQTAPRVRWAKLKEDCQPVKLWRTP